MATGVLFALVCPMLEDELVYALKNDPDDKNVVLLESPHSVSIKRKLKENGVDYSEMSETVFMNYGDNFPDDGYNVVIRMKDLGLHKEPKDLKANIEQDLTDLNGKVDAVALYYGMCGNFGWDPEEWAEENLDYPVRIFKDTDGRVIDDCVGVAVGGLKPYQKLLREFTGCMLFTPAIATNWLDFMSASDLMRGLGGEGDVEKTKANLKWILELCGYNSVVQIDTGYEDREEFDYWTKDFADYNGFTIQQADPSYPDLGPAERIYAESKALLEREK